MEASTGGVPWWLGGFKGTLLRALANVSVTVNNVVVKYLAPRSVATLTCTRLATFTADLGDGAISEVRLAANWWHEVADQVPDDPKQHLTCSMSCSCLKTSDCKAVMPERCTCQSAGGESQLTAT